MRSDIFIFVGLVLFAVTVVVESKNVKFPSDGSKSREPNGKVGALNQMGAIKHRERLQENKKDNKNERPKTLNNILSFGEELREYIRSLDELIKYSTSALSEMTIANDSVFETSKNHTAIPETIFDNSTLNLYRIAHRLQEDGFALKSLGEIIVNNRNNTTDDAKMSVDKNEFEFTATVTMLENALGQTFLEAGDIFGKLGVRLENDVNERSIGMKLKIEKTIHTINSTKHNLIQTFDNLCSSSDKYGNCKSRIFGFGIDTEVCFKGFEDLGCFSLMYPWILDKFIPFRRATRPEHPDLVDTQFYLFTRNHPKKYKITKRPRISLRGSDYKENRMTFFITHGYRQKAKYAWLIDMKNSLLKKMDANVILVDWEKGARNNYFNSASNIRVVGAEMTRLVLHLIKYQDSDVSRIHPIGFSLGAHASSYLAKNIKMKTGRMVGQLTALDPAAPLFEVNFEFMDYDKAVRLDKTDATFVQVIHTSARMIVLGGLGMTEPHGHVDFYLNGGAYQPGCMMTYPKIMRNSNFTRTSPFLVKLRSLSEHFWDAFMICHHSRAYEYFISSLVQNNCSFLGYKADDKKQSYIGGYFYTDYVTSLKQEDCREDTCTPLGIDTVHHPARGIFVVKTTGEEPYCRDSLD